MKRPNKLDWLVYRLFRWWWNPIVRNDIHALDRLIVALGEWRREYVPSPKTDWRRALDRAKAEMISAGLVKYAARIRQIELSIPNEHTTPAGGGEEG